MLYQPAPPFRTTGVGFRARASALQSWLDVCWSPQLKLFVAVSTVGAQSCMTSPDGIVWTLRNTPATGWNGICWSPQLRLFVAVGSTSAQRVMTSPDGINWTLRNSADNARLWYHVTWSPQLGLFCATSTDAIASVMTSPDGINWTLRATPVATVLRNICWAAGANKFVAVSPTLGDGGIVSPDGINWTQVSIGATRGWFSVQWAPDIRRFAALGSGAGAGTFAAWSEDGLNWHDAVTVVAGAGIPWTALEWCSVFSAFVGVTNVGATIDDQVIFSRDGNTWLNGSSSELIQWRGLAFSQELCMLAAVAATGAVQRAATSCVKFVP